jgi:hypothetical protein
MNTSPPTRRFSDLATSLPAYPYTSLRHPLSEQPMGQFSVETWDLVGRTERVLFLRDSGIARLWLAVLS